MSLSTIMNFGKYVTCFFVVVLSIPFLGACDAETQWVLRSEPGKYSFARFLESIEKFPYTADQSKLSKVREGFKRLSLGMRKDDVKKILGEPDSEMVSYKPKQKSKELIYSTWAYYLKRFERDLATEDFDEVVFLHFKPNEELYWADPGNIAGLEPVGGSALYPEGVIEVKVR